MRTLEQIAVLAAIASLTASAHAAGITYLDCNMVDSRGDKSRFTVSLDETAGRATHSDGARDFTAPAIFAMDTITYKTAQSTGGSIVVTQQYSINRSDLSIVHLFRAEASGLPPKELSMTGTCTKTTPKKRKI